MSIPGSVVLVPVPVIVPVAEASPTPEAGQGWLRGAKRPWPIPPATTQWPLRQPIPHPDRKERMDAARRLLAERRAEHPVHT